MPLQTGHRAQKFPKPVKIISGWGRRLDCPIVENVGVFVEGKRCFPFLRSDPIDLTASPPPQASQIFPREIGGKLRKPGEEF